MNNPKAPSFLSPIFGKDSICLAFSVDKAYVPYLAVTLQSLLAHANPKYCYDVIVLHSGLPAEAKSKLLTDTAGNENFSLRFFDVSAHIQKIRSLFYTTLHFSEETYYRLLLPQILPSFDKIIYLDCDLVLLSDPSLLWDIPLENHLLAATRAVGAINVYFRAPAQRDYWDNRLHLSDPTLYIQAGVCIFNLKLMRQEDTSLRFLQTLENIGNPPLVDQDIISSVCQKQTLFLPQSWNYNWHLHDIQAHDCFPPQLWKDFEASRENPLIFHFSSPKKPWKDPSLPGAEYFWRYARKSIFYEEILYANIRQGFTPKHQSPVPSSRGYIFYNYYRCKILSKITWGNKRRHYKQKRNKLHEQVRQIRNCLKH